MIKKVAIKNPGCQFCKYHLEPIKVRKKLSKPACAKGARRIYEQGVGLFGLRRWKWVDCLDPEIKNGDRFCDDFEVSSLANTAIQALIVLLHRGYEQTPSAFRTERWWNDEQHKLKRKFKE